MNRKVYDSLATSSSFQPRCSAITGSFVLLQGTTSLRSKTDDFVNNDLQVEKEAVSVMANLDKTRMVTPLLGGGQIRGDHDSTKDMREQPSQDRASVAPAELEGEQDNHVDKVEKEGQIGRDLCEENDALYHTKYELRPQGRGYKPGFTSTWMDKDETGDYDPDEDRRQLAKRNSKRKAQVKPLNIPSCDKPNEGFSENNIVQSTRPELVVKLSFASKQSLGDLIQASLGKLDLEHNILFGGRRLRRRGVETTRNQSGTIPNTDLDDQYDRLGHFLGHPAARGCRQCFDINARCSLQDEDRSGPCVCCDEFNTECELITIPKYKGSCERCRKHKMTCSYTFTLDHSGACADCTAKGFECIAGPVKDSMRPRIRYDAGLPAEEIMPFCGGDLRAAALPAQREFKPKLIFTCGHCVEAGRRCSLTRSTEDAVCTACDMSGTICIRQPLTGSLRSPCKIHRVKSYERLEEKPGSGKKRPATVSDLVLPPTKKQRVGLSSHSVHPWGELKQIDTRFSHPIFFNHDQSLIAASEDNTCHFCAPKHFAYSLLGTGEKRTITVLDDPSNPGLVETKPSPYEQTRMCVACTTARVCTMSCPSHHLRPIPNIDMTTHHFESVLTNLFAPTHIADTTRRDRWCSLCPSLAVVECATQSDVSESKNKCQLALCAICVTELQSARYMGNLQALLADFRDERNAERPLGLRADWELLKANGLVDRFVRWDFMHLMKCD